MFSFTVIIDKLITYLVFSAKGYGEILLGRIGVCHPIVIYESGRKCFFLINLLKVNIQKKNYMCGIIDNHREVLLSGLFPYDTLHLITIAPCLSHGKSEPLITL